MDLKSASHSAIGGHKVQDSIVYPGAGYIYLIWTQFADGLGMDFESTPVVLRDVRFERATTLRKDQPAEFFSIILRASGRFELKSDTDDIVASGVIERLQRRKKTGMQEGVQTAGNYCSQPEPTQLDGEPSSSSSWLPLSGEDFYKYLNLRGVNMSGDFQSVEKFDNEGTVLNLSP